MANERRALQAALVNLERTMDTTHDVLDEAGSACETLRSRVADKVPVADAFAGMGIGWSDVARALDDLERARHRVRKAVFALGLSEGMTIGELGRLYGFSRQLAARIASEVRADRS